MLLFLGCCGFLVIVMLYLCRNVMCWWFWFGGFWLVLYWCLLVFVCLCWCCSVVFVGSRCSFLGSFWFLLIVVWIFVFVLG